MENNWWEIPAEEDPKGGYDYEFVDSVGNDDYLCPICQLVVRNAFQVNCCGKIFCEGCLKRLRKNTNTCPMCRENIGDKSFKDTRGIREINQLRVFCGYRINGSGCSWIGELCSIEDHMQSCDYKTVKCDICEQSVFMFTLEKHKLSECQMRSHACSLCKVKGTFAFITTEHQNVCPEVLMPCQNNGCGKKIKHGKMASHTDECPKQVIECPFNYMGCTFKSCREDLSRHIEKGVTLHVEMISKRTQIHHHVAPVVFKFSDFDHSRKVGKKWQSEGFYTGEGGYKVRLNIHPNGQGEEAKSHISVFLNVMPGANDDTIEWPLTGVFTISILNQLADSNHHSFVLYFDDKIPLSHRQRKHDMNNLGPGRGKKKFISHESLLYDSNRETQYLINDTLYFRVTVDLKSKTKPWLAIK